MILESLPSGPLEVNCYIVGCENTRKAVVIDPGGNVEAILDIVKKHELEVVMIINTHGHFDHIGGNKQLQEATGAELLAHRADRSVMTQAREHAAIFGLSANPSPAPTRELVGRETLQVGDLRLRVMHTPGHSAGGICLYVEDCLFSGDTLFAGSVGRTDLPEGDYYQLISSIKEQLLGLPDETKVYPGHGPATTIGNEKQHNPFLV